MLNVSVNNIDFTIADDCDLSQLIILAGFGEQSIALAINGEFIPKGQYSNTRLCDNDHIDIVKPIGGG